MYHGHGQTKEGDTRAIDVIKNWLRNRNTIEFLGAWESLNNPGFKVEKFEHFRNQAGLNAFVLNPQTWIEHTGALGMISKSGRYGGTYAHRDIAFEFGSWISPTFKLYLIKEFHRLKEKENDPGNLQWNLRRSIAATNYRVHTDAVKEKLIPWSDTLQKGETFIYAEEADLINLALFGLTAKQWKDRFPEEAKEFRNIRDYADTHQLIVLSNLESLNAVLIRNNIMKQKRFEMMREAAVSQLASLKKTLVDPSAIAGPNHPLLL